MRFESILSGQPGGGSGVGEPEELAVRDVTSRGFHRFRCYLAEYARCERFTSLVTLTGE
jgi:hypothetical protein